MSTNDAFFDVLELPAGRFIHPPADVFQIDAQTAAWIDLLDGEKVGRGVAPDLDALRRFVDWLAARGVDPDRVDVARQLYSSGSYRAELRRLRSFDLSEALAAQRVVGKTLDYLFPSRREWTDFIRKKLREDDFARKILPPIVPV